MTETRRTALKMLGAVGATCAFPFAGDELYGQHAHVPAAPAGQTPPEPAFFTAAEFATVARVADIIIPSTETPGASGAGVPAYIDLVVAANPRHQPLVRAGLARLEQDARATGAASVVAMPAPALIALLRTASDVVDREDAAARRARFRADETGRLVYFVATTDRDAARTPPLAQVADDAMNIDDPMLPARFFRLMKNLTADGYYTSRVGLLDELGYAGNTALLAFPSCVPEA